MLYNFEKYYLSRAIYKIFVFISKFLSYTLIRYFVIAVGFIIALSIAGMIMVYFILGVNVFLDMVHLEKFRITELHFLSSTIDLKPFYKK